MEKPGVDGAVGERKGVMEERPAARARLGSTQLAAAAFVLWLVHAIDLVLRNEAIDLLWLCNVAGPLLAFGCWTGERRAVSVALLWLAFGTPLWGLDMLDGGEIIPSSFLSHLGGLALGVVAVRRLGWAPGAWWMALVGQVAMLLLSRVATPAERNINLAFRVWDGWEAWFPSYASYFFTLLALSGAGYLALTWIFRRIRVGPGALDRT